MKYTISSGWGPTLDPVFIPSLPEEPEKAFGSWPGSGNWPQPFDQRLVEDFGVMDFCQIKSDLGGDWNV